MIRIAVPFICLCLALCPSLRADDQPLRTTADRRIDIQHIRLDVSLDLKAQSLAGTAQIDLTVLQPGRQVILDAVDHDVAEILLVPQQGEPVPLEFEDTGRQLQIDMGRQLERGEEYRLRIAYSVTEPQSGMHFFKPSDDEPDVPWMAWTQGEPRHNHYWFPCVDHPSERQSTEILATVDQRFRVLSNGKLIERTPVDGDRTRYHWLQEKPHVSYLVTLVVGEFAVAQEQWRGRPVTYYAPPDREADIVATFGRTLEMLDFFSEKFGIEYPWDQYAQVVVEQFTSGGMENTSATTLYDGVMHDERALLDSTPDRLIAHELGHQWWGDLVTCKDWAHLWLNEGFATYCEVLWWEHALGRDEADYLLWGKSDSARSGSTRERPIVDRFYPSPGTMFDIRAYPKAGWVLHMLRHQVGDEDFFRALQRYGTAYSFQTAETSDLRKVFSELTGLSLERFFYDWTERAGHPVLSVATSWQPEDKLVKLVIRQEQKEEPFVFPLTVELVAEDTAESVTLERDIDERELTVYVPMVKRPQLVRVDPGLTLLAEVKETKSDGLWKQQLVAAPSVVERIRAVEHYGGSKKAADRKLLAATLNEDDFYGVRVEAATALGRSGGEFCRDALIEGLQAEHPKVRRSCAKALAKFDDDETAAEALKATLETDEPSYYVRGEVIESLSKIAPEMQLATLTPFLDVDSHREVVRQAALTAIGRTEDATALQTLSNWTEKGRKRSCRIAAMKALANYLIRQEVAVAQQTECVELLTSYLSGEGPHQRRAAAEALGALGRIGEAALPRLSAVAEHDPHLRVRTAAETSIKAIRDRDGDGKEVQRLRDELDDLRELNETLEDRLLKLESQ